LRFNFYYLLQHTVVDDYWITIDYLIALT